MRRSYFITFLSCLIAQPVLSQNDIIPGLLIFDPVLLQVELIEPIVLNEIEGESEGSIEYIELGSLPSTPASASPLFFSSVQGENLPPLNQTASAISFALSVDQYEKSIRALELEGGPYEARLSQELLALGNIYQQQGDQQQALDFFGKALHVNRINYGLYDLSQTPIVEEIIESHLSSGNLQTANDQQEYIFYLQNRVYDSNSLELLDPLESFASWNLLAFTLPLGITPADGLESPAFSLTADTFDDQVVFRDFLINRLINAHNAYLSISRILLNNYGLNDRRLLESEQRIALINYFFATNFETNYNDNDLSMINSSYMGYRYGREALQRRIEYLHEMENVPPEELAEAIAELGDWYVIFRKRAAAAEHYEQARQILLTNETPEARINEILDTPYMAPIPSFLAPKNTRKANNIPKDIALNYRGYIDLEFIIDRYGIPSTIKLIGKTVNTSPRIESQLASQLRRTQFRPRVVDGYLVKKDQYTLRYYYSY